MLRICALAKNESENNSDRDSISFFKTVVFYVWGYKFKNSNGKSIVKQV